MIVNRTQEKTDYEFVVTTGVRPNAPFPVRCPNLLIRPVKSPPRSYAPPIRRPRPLVREMCVLCY